MLQGVRPSAARSCALKADTQTPPAPLFGGGAPEPLLPFVRQKEAKSQFWSVQTYYLTGRNQTILQSTVGKQRLAALTVETQPTLQCIVGKKRLAAHRQAQGYAVPL